VEAKQAIDTFTAATAANRATPGRNGSLVRLSATDGADIVVSADLHGHAENFQQLTELADLAANPLRHLVMQEVCHGGPRYESGGCMSHLLLLEVAKLKSQHADRFHFLLSNHELSEATDHPILKEGKVLNVLFRCGMHEEYGEDTSAVREGMCEFLLSCPLAIQTENRIWLGHSIPSAVDKAGFDTSIFEREIEDADRASGGDAFLLVWGRDYRPENAAAFAEKLNAELLITGHEPCAEGYQTPNPHQIILDTCCDTPTYLLLPLDQPITQDAAVKQIRTLA